MPRLKINNDDKFVGHFSSLPGFHAIGKNKIEDEVEIPKDVNVLSVGPIKVTKKVTIKSGARWVIK